MIENRVIWRMAVLVRFQRRCHENGHAPDDAVLDHFVELGRFLGQLASQECRLGFWKGGGGLERGLFTP